MPTETGETSCGQGSSVLGALVMFVVGAGSVNYPAKLVVQVAMAMDMAFEGVGKPPYYVWEYRGRGGGGGGGAICDTTSLQYLM